MSFILNLASSSFSSIDFAMLPIRGIAFIVFIKTQSLSIMSL